MSLNWNVSKIRNSDKICWDEHDMMRPVTDVLIWMTMSVSLPTITEDNVPEWVFRIKVMDELHSYFLVQNSEGHPRRFNPSVEDVVNHIGLSTNASYETRKVWLKRRLDAIVREASYGLSRERDNIEKALKKRENQDVGLGVAAEPAADCGSPAVATAG